MKAVRIHEYGDAGVLRYEDSPEPSLKDRDVLLKVCAAGVNPLDWKVRQGYLKAIYDLSFPAILGWDVSGVVAARGAKATQFAVGDEVYARTEMGRDGAYADYVAVDEAHVAYAPKSLPLDAAAAIPMACLTAWTALFDTADLKPEQTVLIHAGAGGVGGFAVQLAKTAGARVIATASGDGLALTKALGADEVVDHTAEDFSERLRGLDAVIDTVGGRTLERSYGLLRAGGVLATVAGTPDKAEAEKLGIRATFVAVSPNGPRLAEIARLFDDRRLRVPKVTRFPLTEARAAQEMSATGRTRGKIILSS